MKRTLTLFACVAVCCAMMVSCKNAKTTEPTPEEIQVQKIALADSVLAEVDAFAEEYILASGNGVRFGKLELTEDEKMVKPDYLLDPSLAETLITKSQKINALAIYTIDFAVRQIYDMPLDETKAVIAKLAAELNHPIDANVLTDYSEPLSEKVKKVYKECRERDELAYFWQFQNAIMRETKYLLSKNADLFFNKISDAQIAELDRQWDNLIDAVKFLAEYDEEMTLVLNNTYIPSNREEFDNMYYSSSDAAAEMYKSNKFQFIERRNALLQ